MSALLKMDSDLSAKGSANVSASLGSVFALGNSSAADVFWLFRLLPTLTVYGTLLLLGHFLVRCVTKQAKRNENLCRRHCLLRLIRQFAVGQPEHRTAHKANLERGSPSEKEHLQDDAAGDEERQNCGANREQLRRRRFLIDCLSVIFYFVGIQITLVCMGFFQERIVTRGYRLRTDPKTTNFFRDTQFLVFANRIVALALSGAFLFVTWKRQPLHVAPLYLHSFASFSNVLSSWCQYEALKYVSFPAQTVCKASKIVPTMLMGKLLRGQRYSIRQYVFALTLVFGTSLFFLSTSSQPVYSPHFSTGDTPNGQRKGASIDWVDYFHAHSNALSGFVLMLGYLLFDAFTPNWQKKLLEQPPRISCSQMMFGVNAFSVLICLASLVQQWTLASSVYFLLLHESILVDCLFLSAGSALGQVFIYLTIQQFGPVVLSVIMTLRQILSIILSAVYFVHPINAQGLCGLSIVFGTIFFDIYGKYSKNVRRRGANNVVN